MTHDEFEANNNFMWVKDETENADPDRQLMLKYVMDMSDYQRLTSDQLTNLSAAFTLIERVRKNAERSACQN